MMKADPHNAVKNWKLIKEKDENGIEGISKKNSKIILQYLHEMETGSNISGTKGARSPIRLIALRSKIVVIAKLFESNCKKDLIDVEWRESNELFDAMRKGIILNMKGKPYTSTADYVKVFKAFWHWWMKSNRREGNFDIVDITTDLNSSYDHKPIWQEFTYEQHLKLVEEADAKHSMFIRFLFETMIRAPTEAFSIKAADIIREDDGYVYINIRDEYSKTFGRKFKLLVNGERLIKYISDNNLKPEDPIFNFSASGVNRYLNRLGYKVLGIGEEYELKNGRKQIRKGVTMYDFRHNGICHYQNHMSSDQLIYRTGHTDMKMIAYYSEYKGKKDTVIQEDLIDRDTKTQLEYELEKLKAQVALQQENIEILQKRKKESFDEVYVTNLIKAVKGRGDTIEIIDA